VTPKTERLCTSYPHPLPACHIVLVKRVTLRSTVSSGYPLIFAGLVTEKSEAPKPLRGAQAVVTSTARGNFGIFQDDERAPASTLPESASHWSKLGSMTERTKENTGTVPLRICAQRIGHQLVAFYHLLLALLKQVLFHGSGQTRHCRSTTAAFICSSHLRDPLNLRGSTCLWTMTSHSSRLHTLQVLQSCDHERMAPAVTRNS
jgi:hypothetical protein